MSRYALLPLALAAAAVSPAVAAQTGPVCHAALLNAATGAATTCLTQGPPPLGNRNVGAYRTVYVTVVSGSVHAALRCGELLTAERTVTSTAMLGGWSGGQDCVVTLTALADGTAANAVSVGSYVIDLD